MNKILILGHPASPYQGVEALLNTCGMSPALPSRREGMSPQEIGATLLRAHGLRSPIKNSLNEGLCQIEPGPVWHGMALDLMLGNLEQEVWGWADPDAVHLLDYWRSLEPGLAYVLIYDSPRTLLSWAATNDDLSQEKLEELVSNWCAYNEELLRFYRHNVDRSLLVHGEQAMLTATRYVEEVSTRIGAPLRVPMSGNTESDKADESGKLLADPRRVGRSLCRSEESVGIAPKLSIYLADNLIREFPRVQQLYEELQSTATLPLAEIESSQCTALDAWCSGAKLALNETDLQAALSKAMHELEINQSELRQQKIITESLHEAEQLARERLEQFEAVSRKLRQSEETLVARQNLDKENVLLITQLHQLQEEIELRHLESQQQRKRIAEMQDRINAMSIIEAENAKVLPQLRQANDALQRARSTIEEKDKKIELLLDKEKLAKDQAQKIEDIFKQQKDLAHENALLIAQLHVVQEELERYHLNSQLPNIDPTSKSAVEVEKTLFYGAADRIKRQLSYRLGAIMISHSKSMRGLCSMPWALYSEARIFQSEKKMVPMQKLPPIWKYEDSHEAERVKKHLSYRLGAILIANMRSPIGWFKLPRALRKEVLIYRLEKGGH